MAYSDYGSFVYCNNERREDKEDVALFATDEETFGESSAEILSGDRIWVSLTKAKEDGKSLTWIEYIHHGIIGDGNIRVLCHKQHLPEVYERMEDGTIQKINLLSLPEFQDKGEIPDYQWGKISFSYKGYKFSFESGKPNFAFMNEPDGKGGFKYWVCVYDYMFGAGFEDTDDD